MRNFRSIVDRIFTRDGLAFPACGSDHYQPIEIAIKELLPINLAVLPLIEAGMICLLGCRAFKNDSTSQFVDNAVQRRSSNRIALNKSSFLGFG